MRTAVVIGGGPAGCACAIELARAGWGVTLAEAKPFPRVKVCGEFISPAATADLEALLTTSELRAAGAQRVRSFALDLDDRSIVWPMPSPAWVLSRAALDDALLARVRAAGVDVRQPVRVRDVEYAADRVAVTLDAGDELAADIVVHADGRGRFDPAGPTPNRAGVVGLKCHLRAGVAVQGIRMRACRHAYVGTVAVEGGRATCALVARASLVRTFQGDHDAMVRSLWPGFDAAWRETAWLACPVAGSRYVTPGHARSIRIGNAAAAVEPVGGEGIGLALWSGRRAAAHLSAQLAALDDGSRTADADTLARMQRDFARDYRVRLRWRLPACRAAAWLLEKPGLVRTIWPLLAPRPARRAIIGPWYALTGK